MKSIPSFYISSLFFFFFFLSCYLFLSLCSFALLCFALMLSQFPTYTSWSSICCSQWMLLHCCTQTHTLKFSIKFFLHSTACPASIISSSLLFSRLFLIVLRMKFFFVDSLNPPPKGRWLHKIPALWKKEHFIEKKKNNQFSILCTML